MSLPSWQRQATGSENGIPASSKVPFPKAKKFFAVDASGSTIGEIMRAQRRTALALHENSHDQVVLWETKCGKPRFLNDVDKKYFNGYGGTSPDCIFEEKSTVDQIIGSDLWVLMTDGEIASSSVSKLTQEAERLNVLHIPVVLVVTGTQYATPDQANISVGVSFFASAQEALILFQDHATAQIFVIAAKGIFEPLKPDQDDSLLSWDSLPSWANGADFSKHCGNLGIDLLPSEERKILREVSLGAQWDKATGYTLVDVPILLDQVHIRLEDLRNLLEEEAITQLTLLCKTRGQLGVLRDLLLRHRQTDIIVRFEDFHGAGEIMGRMQSDTTKSDGKDCLMEELRAAHVANRETHLAMKNSQREKGQLASEMNKLINRGLAIIASFAKSSYTADILNRRSNRAMRSETLTAVVSEVHLAALDLSDGTNASRGTCPICCGEEQIMSIVLKKLDTVEENTTDFALNFPLAAAQAKQNANMISSQCICFQCALLCPRSIYKEDIVATIPAVDYEGVNRKFINHQLTLAITAGLSTGLSGIIQVFMTLLDRVLETKRWCSEDHIYDPEILSRRQVFEWMLDNLLQRCPCREDFKETGKWVSYPQALLWALKEYETAGLDSWIIQYPLAGFSQLLRWYQLLDPLVSQSKIRTVQQAKLLHHTVAIIMNNVLRKHDYDNTWKDPFLRLIYREFNAPKVPKDLGVESIADDFWLKIGKALGQKQDIKRFLTYFEGEALQKVREDSAPRIQLLASNSSHFGLFIRRRVTLLRGPFLPISNIESHLLQPSSILG